MPQLFEQSRNQAKARKPLERLVTPRGFQNLNGILIVRFLVIATKQLSLIKCETEPVGGLLAGAAGVVHDLGRFSRAGLRLLG